MNVVVFGANGRVGTIVVDNLLQKNYKVTAFVHGASRLKPHNNLSLYKGDIYNYEDVEGAMRKSEVVISTLGSWGTPKKDILQVGMQHIIPAMKKLNIVKIVSLTGSEARYENDDFGFIHNISHALLRIVAAKILIDSEKHINLLSSSHLKWAVVRSPVMTNSGNPKSYVFTTKRPHPWQTINRNSVATAIVEIIEKSDFEQKAIYISRR